MMSSWAPRETLAILTASPRLTSPRKSLRVWSVARESRTAFDNPTTQGWPRGNRHTLRIDASKHANTSPATIDLNFDSAISWLGKGAQPTNTAKAILSYSGVLLKKHLDEGVKKGAFTEAEAKKRFDKWMKEKSTKIQKKIEDANAALESNKKEAREREEEYRKKKLEESKAKEEAKADETPAEEAPAEEAPAEEAPAEEAPAEEAPAEEAAAEEAPAEEAAAEEAPAEEADSEEDNQFL